MKRPLTIAATVVALFILQSLPAYRLTDFALSMKLTRLQADIGCILAIYLGMRETNLVRGALIACVVGLFANSFAPTSMRIYAFLAPLCFVLTYVSNVAFFFKRTESQALFIFVISLIYNFIFFYLMNTASHWHGRFVVLLGPAILQALMNAGFGAIMFTFFDWITEYDERATTQRYRF